MDRIALFMLFSLAAGCMTTGAKITEFVTDPPGATVRVEGYGECETPCTVELDSAREVTVAKAGYKAQRLQVEPGRSQIELELELVAPTDDVEEQTLPEL